MWGVGVGEPLEVLGGQRKLWAAPHGISQYPPLGGIWVRPVVGTDSKRAHSRSRALWGVVASSTTLSLELEMLCQQYPRLMSPWTVGSFLLLFLLGVIPDGPRGCTVNFVWAFVFLSSCSPLWFLKHCLQYKVRFLDVINIVNYSLAATVFWFLFFSIIV